MGRPQEHPNHYYTDANRVITGKINPGIVRISPKLKTDLGVTLLANSITLTPGTLTVDIDEKTNDLYVHWIAVKEEALKKTPRDYEYVSRLCCKKLLKT